MESINKIEIQGRIGAVTSRNSSNTHARFNVATNYVYTDRNGSELIETTWHECECFENSNVTKDVIAALDKSVSVNVKGRIRRERYYDENGEEHQHETIFVSELTILDEPAIDAESDARQIQIRVMADENHAADALRQIADYIDNAESEEEIYGSELEDAHFFAEIDLPE